MPNRNSSIKSLATNLKHAIGATSSEMHTNMSKRFSGEEGQYLEPEKKMSRKDTISKLEQHLPETRQISSS